MAENLPWYGTAFNVTVHLYTSSGLITNPGTITCKISKDYGDYANCHGTGPTEEDSTYGQIKVALDATDMTAYHIDGYVIDNTSGCFAATFHIDTIPVVRGMSGTALPAAAADAAGGLPISDAGGLDLDTYIKRLGASVVTVTSPVSVDASTVTLVCGDDYYDADGRALTFTDSGGTYPSFTGGSCKFTVRDLAKGTNTETAGTIVDANTVRFELTKTATGAWTAGGKYRFDVEVTLANGHEVTIATGTVTMLAKYSG